MLKWNSIFDGFICISLEEDILRRQEALLEFEKVGLSNLVEFLIVNRPSNGNARYGCYSSHQKALLLAKNRGWKTVVIFEDDVQFIKKKMNNTLTSLKDFTENYLEWDALLLGWLPLRASKTSNKSILKVHCGAFTHAYVANSSLIEAGLPDINKNDQYDVDFVMFCSTCSSSTDNLLFLKTKAPCENKLKVFALKPMIAFQKQHELSNIIPKNQNLFRNLLLKLIPVTFLEKTVPYIQTKYIWFLTTLLTFIIIVISIKVCVTIIKRSRSRF